MNDVVIKLENVSKYYKLYQNPRDRLKEALSPTKKTYHKKYYALEGINLQVKKGEVLGIVGKNGCGKSTLLKLITGVLQANTGSVSVKGKITALLELGAGFNPEFTGLDNILFYGKILGFTDQQVEDKLDDIIEFAEIGEYLRQPVKTYSSGMKARLAFAVAAHIEPEILILDEVLAVGDDAFKAKCFRVIQNFFESGITVLLVSHSIHNINQLCSRAILIEDGSIAASSKPKDITQLYHRMLFGDKKAYEIINDENVDKLNIANQKKTQMVSYDWDKKLVSKPINMLSEMKITTSGYRLLNHEGLQVNILRVNESYQFFFDAELQNEIIDTTLFGITFVNSKGIHVCGMEPTLISIDNSPIGFKAEFNCILNEDIYTIIVASRLRTEQAIFYSRVENIGNFKVINPESSPRWGLVQL